MKELQVKKYRKNSDGKTVIMISNNASGMGKNTIGTTFVIYKDEEYNLDFPFVMTNNEFHDTYSKITD